MNHPVVTDTSGSRNARLKPVPLTSVRFTGGLLAERQSTVVKVSLAAQYQQMESTGRLENFRRIGEHKNTPFQGYIYNDSDVYKWLEGASWALALPESSQLLPLIDQVIGWIAAAQQPDGYLDTYFIGNRDRERWTNLKDAHELYCAGHLFQAAVAHHRVTGSDRLLLVAVRLADHIVDLFGEGKREGIPGHPEIEMALVELFRETGNPLYLTQAQLFIDRRGRGLIGGYPYYIDHVAFRELQILTGHAVRALYLNSGAADLYQETGDPSLLSPLLRMWERMDLRQRYVTGALGARHDGESFGDDYEMPNERAYAERCAGIASMMWNWRMLQLQGEARYADGLEWALYNAVLPGLSLDGKLYFYINPLADSGGHRRQPYYACACCPPNITRLIAQLSGYFYSRSGSEVWVHLYGSHSADIALEAGSLKLQETTGYPFDGEIQIEVQEAPESDVSLHLRIPGWMEGKGASILLNGQPIAHLELKPGVYATITRTWQPGDRLHLSFPMPVRFLEAHPYILEDQGKTAVTCGPLVYCAEELAEKIDLRTASIDISGAVERKQVPDLPGAIEAISLPAVWDEISPEWEHQLYRPLKLTGNPAAPKQSSSISLIPYFAWANRASMPMRVWLRYK
jgi:DUF1680 family protein